MRKNQYKNRKKAPFPLKKIGKTDFVMGVDEAGRGAWAGPVVAACVAWSGKNPLKNILRDSKKMNEKNREITYDEILQLVKKWKLFYGVGIISHTVIDTVGIREANRLAMQEALSQMQNSKFKVQNEGFFILIDGRDNYIFDIPDLPQPEYIIWGDDIVPQIMAASIVAKVTRDRIMVEYEMTLPWYWFEKHKGYGTAIHQQSLKKQGVTEIHRTSYAPIKLATSWKGL